MNASDSYRDALNKAASVVRKLAMERDEIGADADIRAALLHAVCEIEALPSSTPEHGDDTKRMEYLFDILFDDEGDHATKVDRMRSSIDRAIKKSSEIKERLRATHGESKPGA